jgi:DNA-binding LacI/PurR family transcriptional regulator
MAARSNFGLRTGYPVTVRQPNGDVSAKKPGRPTVNTVAERAGVSKSLVSLVMRNAPHVSDARRAAVLKAAEELGYRPNYLARSLVQQRSNTVGLVVSDMENPFWIGISRSLQDVLEEANLRVLLADAHRGTARDITLVEAFLELRVDALCLLGSRSDAPRLRAAMQEVPTVIVAGAALKLRSVDLVTIDDDAGMKMIIEHLLDLGHTRIGLVADDSTAAGSARTAAYREVMSARGLQKHITLADTDGSPAGSRAAAHQLLGRRSRPTAIATESDFSTVGVLAVADELGIAVPRELSVTGYDNTPMADIPQLSLTSVDINSVEVGRTAGMFLLSRMANPQLRRRERRIRPTLIPRRSTQAPVR